MKVDFRAHDVTQRGTYHVDQITDENLGRFFASTKFEGLEPPFGQSNGLAENIYKAD